MVVFRNNSTQRKNPLVHSKTAPSFLQDSNGKNDLDKSEEHEQNNRNKEIRGTYDDDDRSLNNTKGSGNEIISKPDPNQVDQCSSNIFEMMEKNSYENEGKRQNAMEHDSSKNNFEAENELGNHAYGRSYKQTQNEDSEQENIKDSAGNSVSSSGFESLNQLVSQSNNNRKDIEQTDNTFGVTFVDKENLGKGVLCIYFGDMFNVMKFKFNY